MQIVQDPEQTLSISMSANDAEKPKKKAFNMGKKRRGNVADDILGTLGDELR